ncbi:MAG: hypothetical protein J6Q68_03905 [Clostridia bacterium]|nr:hypothetical protein [Clostridia bacterium]
MRRAIVFLLLFALSFNLFSCSDEDAYTYCELVLPLSDTFTKVEADAFDAAYADGAAVVGITRISYSACEDLGIAPTLEPSQFAHYYMLLSESDYEIKKEGDVPYYSYESDGYFYTFTFYTSKYAYFRVVYSCRTELRDAYEEKFIDYACGARFTM